MLEEESREVPQLLKLPCQHLRAVGWLAGSDKNWWGPCGSQHGRGWEGAKFSCVYVCVYMWVCVYYPISSAVACVTCASKLWRCGLSLEWGMRQGKCGCIYLWTYGGPGVTPHGLPLIEIGWLTSSCGHQEQPWGGAGRGGGDCCAWEQCSFQSMTGRNKHLPLLLHSPRMERGSCRDAVSRLSGHSKSSTDTDNFWLLLHSWISCMAKCWLSLHPHDVQSELARISWV